jgi:hypothetical protein
MRTLSTKLFISAAALIVMTTSAGALLLGRESDKAKEMLSQYERTGEAVSCVLLRNVEDTDAVDDYTLLVEMRNGEMYLNELSGRCAGLEFEQRYVHESTASRMCRGDTIRVLDAFGTERGGCGLGDFEKLSKIENPDS